MGIKDDLEKVNSIPRDMLTLNHKMVLVLSASFYLAGQMAALDSTAEGATEVMRDALGVFYNSYMAMFPDGPLEAQAAIQEFSRQIGIMPGDAWKEAVN
jgi:hypothetical protein